MKLAVGLTFFFSLLLLKQVTADATVYLVVVTLVDTSLVTPTQLESLVASMEALKPSLDSEIEAIALEAEGTFNGRMLRSRSLQSCNPCLGFPTGYYCWWNGKRRPACRRNEEGAALALQVFKPLNDEELQKLNEEDRRRHLQVASMCGEAKADVETAINQEIEAGEIFVPSDALEKHCVYDIEGLA